MSGRKKVLVIEDDVETAKYHAERLYLFGFDCDLAYDGRTALDILRTREYVLVLIDIRLPDSNGLQRTVLGAAPHAPKSRSSEERRLLEKKKNPPFRGFFFFEQSKRIT